MTRALITDPDLPRKAREGKLERSFAASAATPASRTTTPARRSPARRIPRTGRELTLPPRGARRHPRRIVVVGAGPAGLAAAAEAAAAGHDVVRARAVATGSAARSLSPAPLPMHEELARALWRATTSGCSSEVDMRLETWPTRMRLPRSLRTRSSSPRARARTSPRCRLTASKRSRPGTCWPATSSAAARIVVADWGGDAIGLAAAELLDSGRQRGHRRRRLGGGGRDVAPVPAQRLPRAALPGRRRSRAPPRARRGRATGRPLPQPVRAGARSARSPPTCRPRARPRARARPRRALAARGLGSTRPATASSPRSLEEAILEGTLAARQAAQAIGAGSSSR